MEKVTMNKSSHEKFKAHCAGCNRPTNHIVLSSTDVDGQLEYPEGDWISWNIKHQIIQCQGCDAISFRTESSNSDDMIQVGEDECVHAVSEKLYPHRDANTLPLRDFINSAPNLRRIYREVIDCFNNESFTLCAAGLRAIIDGLCADNGIVDGPVEITKDDGTNVIKRLENLQGQISGLHEKGLLTKQHSDALNEHRFMGNSAVHELEQPSIEELRLAISIVEHTLENIYELPEKAAEIRKRKLLRQKKRRA